MLGKNETGIKLIPPFAFLAGFILAGVIWWFVPIRFGLPTLWRWILGIVLIVGPIAFVPTLFALFRQAGSEYDVRKVPKGLVTTGAFRFSRNPGYLAMVVLGVGVAILFDNVWVLPADVIAAAIVQVQVIVKEEAILERVFGEEYRAYKARVRRWV